MKTICRASARTSLLQGWRRLVPMRFVVPSTRFQAKAAAISMSGGAAGAGKRILVIDDDPVIRKTTSAKLVQAGHEVFSAADCSEAIAEIGKNRPDVILLDLNFPPDVANGGGVSWDGFRLMSWLRGLANSRGARFIVISGSHSVENEKRALARGAADFFSKPIDHDRLLQVIENEVQNAEIPKAKSMASFEI
jgi:CheY-like chemotaxis protein